MIPPGAIHLPLKGSAKLARRLGVSYAEAVTGFEFKSISCSTPKRYYCITINWVHEEQRAVPVTEGIIVAEGNEDLLRDAWRTEEEEKKKRADGKREKAALAMWRRFLMGLRIVTRLREEYGDVDDGGVDINPFTVRKSNQISRNQLFETDEREADNEAEENGGFFVEDESHELEGGFIRDDDRGGGGFNGEEEAISYGGGFEVVLDDKDGPSTPNPGRQSPEPEPPSPEARSPYFTKANDARHGGSLVISSNTKLRAKTRIEVQIPIVRVRARNTSEAPVLDSPDIGTPGSSGTRRASKRRAVNVVEAETGQSKYFTDGGESGKRRRIGREK